MSPELLLFLVLAIIIFVSKFAGHMSQRYLKQPVVFGEILAGLLFGPTLLNLFGWPLFSGHAEWLHDIVKVLAQLGVLLLMFIAGLETDLAQMRKVGKTAFWTAIGGVFLPLALGTLACVLFGLPWLEALFIGVVLTATSVSISAQTLMELQKLGSREGLTILGAAVIDDVIGIVILSLVIAFTVPQGSGHDGLVAMVTGFAHNLGMSGQAEILVKILLTLLMMALFFGLAIFVGMRSFHRLLDWADRLHATHIIPAAALLLILLFAIGAEFIGQVAAITGAYLAGIFLARTDHAKDIERSINPFTYAFFVPIFFMSIGLGADARELGGGSWLFVVVIVLIAVIAKVTGCGIGARATGFTFRESLRVGVGMISRGEVGLIAAQIGLSAGIIGSAQYAAMVIMVLATTVVTPVLLRFSFRRQ